mmetsp:Transcript_29967/g.84546  ORF Transcript_29967/g.84546 Transcript_29967/m.84546 type:complete len:910 (+) Transcript_29967:348-3077(+)|eukprot:CAMPEP_0117680506 /NCGR_PEP_ID=MMETSP0804-20121206/18397_1 /TAXON_ID=1074897 /ORGANISM="Tetraselmis astigmatica, Strain CCMP880" /LENGTH=909 /DNA_ID=CAMNT_0005490025 /DNA_START=286 /DNA_END=3015 /DNA_ORIENTATION=-
MSWNGHDNSMFFGHGTPGGGVPYGNAFPFYGNFSRGANFTEPFDITYQQPAWFRQSEPAAPQFRPQFRDYQQPFPFPGTPGGGSPSQSRIRQQPVRQQAVQDFPQVVPTEDVNTFCSPADTTSSPATSLPDLGMDRGAQQDPSASVQQQVAQMPPCAEEGADFWRTPATQPPEQAPAVPVERVAKEADGAVWRPKLGYSRLEMLRSAKKDVWRPGVRMDRGPTLRPSPSQGTPAGSPGSSECTDNTMPQASVPGQGLQPLPGGSAVNIFRPKCLMQPLSDGGMSGPHPSRSRMDSLHGSGPSAATPVPQMAPPFQAGAGFNRNPTPGMDQRRMPVQSSSLQGNGSNGQIAARQIPVANDMFGVPDLDLGMDDSVMDFGFDTGQDSLDVWQAARRDQQEELDVAPAPAKRHPRTRPPQRAGTSAPQPAVALAEEKQPAPVQPRQQPPAQRPPPEKQPKKGSTYAQKGKSKGRDSSSSPAAAASDGGKASKQEHSAKAAAEKSSHKGSHKGAFSGSEKSGGGKQKEKRKNLSPPASLMFYIPRRQRSTTRRIPRVIIRKPPSRSPGDQKPQKQAKAKGQLAARSHSVASPSSASGQGGRPGKDRKRSTSSTGSLSRGQERPPPTVAPKMSLSIRGDKSGLAKLKLKPLSLLSAPSPVSHAGSTGAKLTTPQAGSSGRDRTDSDSDQGCTVLSSQRPSSVPGAFGSPPRPSVIGLSPGSEKKRKQLDGRTGAEGRSSSGKLKKKEHKGGNPGSSPRLSATQQDKLPASTTEGSAAASGRKDKAAGLKGSTVKTKPTGPSSMLAGRQYFPGDIVWAKIGTYPWWPAQVQQAMLQEHKDIPHKATDYFLVFYGDRNVNWLPETSLRPFHWNYERHSLVKGRNLQSSIDEAWGAMGKDRPVILAGEKVNPAMFLK